MRFKNTRNEAKEQPSNIAERLACEFSSQFKLVGAVAAWSYYSALDRTSRRLLRHYRSSNGIIDFPHYLKEVQDSRPCGTASKVEKLSLLFQINQELEALSPRERTSYLNGAQLTLEV